MKTSVLLTLAMVFLLAACTEKPQTLDQKRVDAPPYMGTGTPFVDAGWTAGDKNSWEQHLKVRTQRGQNDYYGNTN